MAVSYNFTLSDIKKQLGNGLGIRSNKYVILVPLPGGLSKKLAVLAKATSLPERNIGTVDLYHKGRRYKVRGDTDLQNTYNISLTDDSEMKLRKAFDAWLRSVDNPETDVDATNLGITGSSTLADAFNAISGSLNAASELASEYSQSGVSSILKNAFIGNSALASYQKNVEVYQLTKSGVPVYGYQLQNCYPTEVGAVEISDESDNQFSEFSVVLTYSDFIPLDPNESNASQILNAILGDSTSDLIKSGRQFIETLTN